MSKTGKSIEKESKLVVAYNWEGWEEMGSNCNQAESCPSLHLDLIGLLP